MVAGDTAKRMRESTCKDLVEAGRKELTDVLEQYWKGSTFSRLVPFAIEVAAATPYSAWLAYGNRELYVYRRIGDWDEARKRFADEGLTFQEYLKDGKGYILIDNNVVE